MNLEKYQKDIDLQKNGLSNFELYVPNVNKEIMDNNAIVTVDTLVAKYVICRHSKINEIKKPLNKLMINFERELGDTIHYTDPEIVFLFCFPVLKPRLQKTENYKYIGFVTVHDDIINLVWLHPFFRNKGLMSRFFYLYALNENILAILPPLTKPMIACSKKTQDLISNDKEIMEKQAFFSRHFLKRKCPIPQIDLLNNDEILQIKYALSLQAGNEQIDLSKLIETCTKTLLYLKENPHIKKELIEYFTPLSSSFSSFP